MLNRFVYLVGFISEIIRGCTVTKTLNIMTEYKKYLKQYFGNLKITIRVFRKLYVVFRMVVTA